MSIAESIVTAPTATSKAAAASRDEQPSLTLSRVVASLQVVLATRRAIRNDDHAYWYTIGRGL
jgi:hypothetical protein